MIIIVILSNTGDAALHCPPTFTQARYALWYSHLPIFVSVCMNIFFSLAIKWMNEKTVSGADGAGYGICDACMASDGLWLLWASSLPHLLVDDRWPTEHCVDRCQFMYTCVFHYANICLRIAFHGMLLTLSNSRSLARIHMCLAIGCKAYYDGYTSGLLDAGRQSNNAIRLLHSQMRIWSMYDG